MRKFSNVPLGIQLATCALVVAVPRYAIAFLAADNIRLWQPIEALLLVVSAIATAVIVAGGGAYVAHVVASAQGHLLKRALLLALWLVLLACEVALLAPPVVASLRRAELAQVLAPPALDALWSIIMVATPALCAAACVLAASLDAHERGHERIEPAHDFAQAALVRTPNDAQPTHEPLVSDLSDLSDAEEAHEPHDARTSDARATQEIAVNQPSDTAATPSEVIICACGRSFGSQQALAAHKRRCPARNGAVVAHQNGAHE